jgi:hypothetical protein
MPRLIKPLHELVVYQAINRISITFQREPKKVAYSEPHLWHHLVAN